MILIVLGYMCFCFAVLLITYAPEYYLIIATASGLIFFILFQLIMSNEIQKSTERVTRELMKEGLLNEK
jgi:hypothetical protein